MRAAGADLPNAILAPYDLQRQDFGWRPIAPGLRLSDSSVSRSPGHPSRMKSPRVRVPPAHPQGFSLGVPPSPPPKGIVLWTRFLTAFGMTGWDQASVVRADRAGEVISRSAATRNSNRCLQIALLMWRMGLDPKGNGSDELMSHVCARVVGSRPPHSQRNMKPLGLFERFLPLSNEPLHSNNAATCRPEA